MKGGNEGKEGEMGEWGEVRSMTGMWIRKKVR